MNRQLEVFSQLFRELCGPFRLPADRTAHVKGISNHYFGYPMGANNLGHVSHIRALVLATEGVQYLGSKAEGILYSETNGLGAQIESEQPSRDPIGAAFEWTVGVGVIAFWHTEIIRRVVSKD